MYDPTTHRNLSFHDCVEDFRAGRDTPRDYLERCLEVIGAREPAVHAFVTRNEAGARAAADAATQRYRDGTPASPVDGLPIGLKDIIETADMPTQCGSALYEDWSGGRDAPVAAALRRGGAVIVGKTASTEFAFGRVTAATNPFDAERTPGTSSSGSAAAVGAAMLPAAIGTQLQSSVVRPASYCGHVGAKPTYGAIRQDAIHPFSPSGEHVGAHAGALEDAWLVLRFLSHEAGPVPGEFGIAGPPDAPAAEPPRRLARMYTPGWELADADVRAAFEDALARLADAGIEIVEPASDPALQALEDDYERAAWCISEVAAFEMRWPFFEYEARGAEFGTRIAGIQPREHEITLDDYHAALDWKAAFRARHQATAEAVDGYVGLAAPEVAPVGLENIGNTINCVPSSCLGVPALTLPVLAAHGLPIGLQLMGFARGDARLFAQARAVRDLFGAG